MRTKYDKWLLIYDKYDRSWMSQQQCDNVKQDKW